MSSLKLTNIGQLITYDSEVNEMLTHENKDNQEQVLLMDLVGIRTDLIKCY